MSVIIVPNHYIIIIIIPLSIELSNGVSVSTLLYPVSLLFGWWSIFHLVELSNGVSVIIVPNHYQPNNPHPQLIITIIIIITITIMMIIIIIIISIWGDWQPWRWSALDNQGRSARWLHWSVFKCVTVHCTLLYTYKHWEFQTKTSLRITKSLSQAFRVPRCRGWTKRLRIWPLQRLTGCWRPTGDLLVTTWWPTWRPTGDQLVTSWWPSWNPTSRPTFHLPVLVIDLKLIVQTKQWHRKYIYL